MAGPRLPSVPPGAAGAAGRLRRASDAWQRARRVGPAERSGCHLWARGHGRDRGCAQRSGRAGMCRAAPAGRAGAGCGRGGAGAPLARWSWPGAVRGGWRGSPPRSAGITWCWGRRGEPPPSSRFSYSFFQSQRSTPARLERGAGLGRAGSAAGSRGAAPQRGRRGSGTSALRCISASDAPSRQHASPAAAAPGGCGSSSSLQLSGDCAWRQVRAGRRSQALGASVPSEPLDGAAAGR